MSAVQDVQEKKQAKPNVSRVILERLKVLDDLPRFPNALMKLEQMLSSNKDVHLDEVAALVAQDPRLTAGIIGAVNSARYSPGYNITNIEEAVQRLGTQDVRMMAHAINYQSTVKTKPPFSEKEFMRHAMLSAFIAQALAKAVHFDQGEAFLCGLMHDLGAYLLAIESRDKYKQVMQDSAGDAAFFVQAEQSVFGTNHAVLGGRLLQQWRFPKEVVMGVALHHAPHTAPEEFQNYAYLTYLAEQGAFFGGLTNGVVTHKGDIPTDTLLNGLDYFGLPLEHYNDLVLSATELAKESSLI